MRAHALHTEADNEEDAGLHQRLCTSPTCPWHAFLDVNTGTGTRIFCNTAGSRKAPRGLAGNRQVVLHASLQIL